MSALVRPLAAALTLIAALLLFASAASAAVVINEIESDDPVVADFVELYNTGAGAVDIGGYVVKDSNDNNSYTIPNGTSIAAGGFYVAEVAGSFGLGSSDAARLFAAGDLVNAIDSYTWTAHAAATWGRCPDGTGAIVGTAASTKGAANSCPVAASPWPGGVEIAFADGVNVFGSNLSGLVYQPSGTSAPGVLWAVRNGPATLFRLVRDGATWRPDTANGWSAGKQLLYGNGTGVPDAEGVTLVAGDNNSVYVSTERNDDGANSNTSRPAVLRYDVTGAAPSLSATSDWNLTADLPGLDKNAGLEAISWIPDDVLVAKGFVDANTGAAYNPAAYANHGSGLFFVGVEQDGRIVAYALDQGSGAYTRVASFASGFPKIMDLSYEPESKLLWAVCDDTCDGRTATLDVAQNGAFAVSATYARPTGMANLNNEGFAIAPQAECVNGRKPVFYADDSNDESHALRTGTLRCTALPAPDGTPEPTPTGSPTGSGTPATTPTPTPTATTPSAVADVITPVLSKLRATRKLVKFTISEAAKVKITVERRVGKRFKRVKAFTVSVRKGAVTVRFKGRVPARKIRRGRLRITLVATDAAGNRSAAARRNVR